MKLPLLALLALTLLPVAVAADAPLSDSAVGTVDAADGRLVLHVYNAGTKTPRPAHLATDYGVLMFRAADGWCRFALAERARGAVREFTNYDYYLDALSKLPAGSTLTIYGPCLVPQFYDFYPVHEELGRKFARDCRRLRLKIAQESRTVCTCPKSATPP